MRASIMTLSFTPLKAILQSYCRRVPESSGVDLNRHLPASLPRVTVCSWFDGVSPNLGTKRMSLRYGCCGLRVLGIYRASVG